MNIVWVIVIVLLAALFAWLWRAGRRASGDGHDGLRATRIGDGLRRLNADKRKYATMTPALLAETPDYALLSAVLANLWAKMRPDLSDAAEVVARQPRERQLLYSLFAVTGGIRQDGLAALLAGADAAYLPDARAALEALDMPGSAALLADALAAEAPDAYDEPYLETFEGEGGKERMTAYIRAHADTFID